MLSSKQGFTILILILALQLAGCGMAPEASIATKGADFAAPIQVTETPSFVIATLFPTEVASEIQPTVKEARNLTLEWPAKIRVGDSDVIRLTLEVDDEGVLTPTALITGHEIRGELVYIPDVYETHNIIAAARLDIAGVQITPNAVIEQPLLAGQRVDYYWSIMTNEIATYRGTVWLYLRFLPLEGGREVEKPLTAQVIEISSVNLLGLGGTPARLLGSVGIIVGALFGLDDILTLLRRGYRYIRKGA